MVSRIPARFQSGSVVGQGHIKNVCREGLFLRTGDLPEPGQAVSISFETETGSKVEVEGVVRWTTDQLPNAEDVPRGFGIQISAPSPSFLEFFEHLLLN